MQHADPPHALALLRARRDRPSSGRAAKRDNEFSPSNVDCNVTLPWGSCPCNGGDEKKKKKKKKKKKYHASIARSAATRARRTACNGRFCAAAILSRPCLLRVNRAECGPRASAANVRCSPEATVSDQSAGASLRANSGHLRAPRIIPSGATIDHCSVDSLFGVFMLYEVNRHEALRLVVLGRGKSTRIH